MKSKLKQVLITGLVVMGIGVISTKRAEAKNPDTMTLSVTPAGLTYAVVITSVNGSGYQFGSVALAGTTVSTAAIVVTNTGGSNVSEYFGMMVSNTSPDSWTPQSGAPAADQFRLIGEFSATQPATGITGFPTADAITGSFPGAAATLYGQASTPTNVAASKNLWLQLEMPTAVNAGSGGAQTMTLYIQGQSS